MAPHGSPAMFEKSSNQVFNNSNLANTGGHSVTVNVAVGASTATPNPAAVLAIEQQASQPQIKGLWLGIAKRLLEQWKKADQWRQRHRSQDTSQREACSSSTCFNTSSASGLPPRLSSNRQVFPVEDNQESFSPTRSIETSDGYSITSLDHLDICSQRSYCSSATSSCSETYERLMYTKGHGYPCAYPQPNERPVKIGDVGVLGSDGFESVFNIYNLPKGSALRSQVPKPSYFYRPQKFDEEYTITSGIAKDKVTHGPGTTASGFEFHCQAQEGGILALPSGADLEKLQDNLSLRSFLCDNAGAIYEEFHTRRCLDPSESIYVVTGQIKSDSWALAAHSEPMQHPDNVLILKNRGIVRPEDAAPTYSWTDKGNAETRRSSRVKFDDYGETIKDQCLFLRGFLITPSPGFRAAPKDTGHDAQGSHDPRTDTKRPDADDEGRGHDSHPTRTQGTSGSSGSRASSSRSTSPTDGYEEGSDAFVDQYPDYIRKEPSYPSHCLNNVLLQETGAQFAITHDDDWRHNLRDLRDCQWEDHDDATRLVGHLREKNYVVVHGNVASWSSKDDSTEFFAAETQANSSPTVAVSAMSEPSQTTTNRVSTGALIEKACPIPSDRDPRLLFKSPSDIQHQRRESVPALFQGVDELPPSRTSLGFPVLLNDNQEMLSPTRSIETSADGSSAPSLDPSHLDIHSQRSYRGPRAIQRSQIYEGLNLYYAEFKGNCAHPKPNKRPAKIGGMAILNSNVFEYSSLIDPEDVDPQNSKDDGAVHELPATETQANSSPTITVLAMSKPPQTPTSFPIHAPIYGREERSIRLHSLPWAEEIPTRWLRDASYVELGAMPEIELLKSRCSLTPSGLIKNGYIGLRRLGNRYAILHPVAQTIFGPSRNGGAASCRGRPGRSIRPSDLKRWDTAAPGGHPEVFDTFQHPDEDCWHCHCSVTHEDMNLMESESTIQWERSMGIFAIPSLLIERGLERLSLSDRETTAASILTNVVKFRLYHQDNGVDTEGGYGVTVLLLPPYTVLGPLQTLLGIEANTTSNGPSAFSGCVLILPPGLFPAIIDQDLEHLPLHKEELLYMRIPYT